MPSPNVFPPGEEFVKHVHGKGTEGSGKKLMVFSGAKPPTAPEFRSVLCSTCRSPKPLL